MPTAHRRRLRFWLVAPLLLLGLLFGIEAVYGQPGRPGGTPQGVLPGGITPAGGGAGGPAGGPANAGNPGNPANPNNPPTPPGFLGGGGIVGGNPGNPANPNQPGLPQPPNGFPANPPTNPPNGLIGGNPVLPQPPPGFPNNPGNNPPNGFVGGNPIGTKRTCTCSKCKGTFTVEGNANPTNCALCGAKFDIVIGNPAGGMFPNGPPGSTPPTFPTGVNPGMGYQGGPNAFQGGPNVVTPPSLPNGFPNNPNGFQGGPNPPGAPTFPDPPTFNSGPNYPYDSNNSAPTVSAGKTVGTAFAIIAGVGIVLLGILIIGGVVTFILIYRGVSSASATAAPRRRSRRPRRDDYDA